MLISICPLADRLERAGALYDALSSGPSQNTRLAEWGWAERPTYTRVSLWPQIWKNLHMEEPHVSSEALMVLWYGYNYHYLSNFLRKLAPVTSLLSGRTEIHTDHLTSELLACDSLLLPSHRGNNWALVGSSQCPAGRITSLVNLAFTQQLYHLRLTFLVGERLYLSPCILQLVSFLL